MLSAVTDAAEQVTAFAPAWLQPLPAVTGATESAIVYTPAASVTLTSLASPSAAVNVNVEPVSAVSAACAAGAANSRTATPARSARSVMSHVIDAYRVDLDGRVS
jgi:hypothetical protein